MLIYARHFCVLVSNLHPGEFTTYSNVLYTYNSLLLLHLPCLQGSSNILSKAQSVQVYKRALLNLS